MPTEHGFQAETVIQAVNPPAFQRISGVVATIKNDSGSKSGKLAEALAQGFGERRKIVHMQWHGST